MRNEFCTLFDLNFLPRGLVLYRSLAEVCPEFRLRVFCMDEATKSLLDRMALPGLVCSLSLEGSAEAGLRLPLEAAGRLRVYHLFVVRARDRTRFRAELAAGGVETLVHYPRPVHRQPAYAHLAPERDRLALTEHICREVVSLLLYPELTDREGETVVRAASTALANVQA